MPAAWPLDSLAPAGRSAASSSSAVSCSGPGRRASPPSRRDSASTPGTWPSSSSASRPGAIAGLADRRARRRADRQPARARSPRRSCSARRSLTAGAAPTLGWLVAGLALWAAANGVIDVAMNSQGAELERRADRPLLSGLHAAHSFGLLAGGLDRRGRRRAPASRFRSHAIAVAAVAVTAGLAIALPRAGRRERGGRTRARGVRGLASRACSSCSRLIAFCCVPDRRAPRSTGRAVYAAHRCTAPARRSPPAGFTRVLPRARRRPSRSATGSSARAGRARVVLRACGGGRRRSAARAGDRRARCRRSAVAGWARRRRADVAVRRARRMLGAAPGARPRRRSGGGDRGGHHGRVPRVVLRAPRDRRDRPGDRTRDRAVAGRSGGPGDRGRRPAGAQRSRSSCTLPAQRLPDDLPARRVAAAAPRRACAPARTRCAAGAAGPRGR